jgi:hypothetical protein
MGGVMSTPRDRWLLSRIGTKDGLKILGDCTVADLEYVLKQSEKRIGFEQGLFQEADKKTQKLIDAMREQGVSTVGELEES